MDLTPNALRPTVEAARQAWARLVDADAEQVARLREPEPAGDYYAPVAGRFSPGQLAATELDVLTRLAVPEDTWLDIGAGGGRFALPLARRVRRVIAVEPSPAMRKVLVQAVAEAGVGNVEVHDLRWPSAQWTEPADVALAAHCLYDIREVGPFVEAMERLARRLCVVLLAQFARGTQLAALFEAVHGEPLHTLPALKEFVALLGAYDRPYEVQLVRGDAPAGASTRDEAYALARRMLWLQPGSAKDQRMCALMDAWWGDGAGLRVPGGFRNIGVVTWQPPNPV